SGELDVHRTLWAGIGRKAARTSSAALAALPGGAVARRRLVGGGDAWRREAAHRQGIHARKFPRSLLHAVHARPVWRAGAFSDAGRGRRTLLSRAAHSHH